MFRRRISGCFGLGRQTFKRKASGLCCHAIWTWRLVCTLRLLLTDQFVGPATSEHKSHVHLDTRFTAWFMKWKPGQFRKSVTVQRNFIESGFKSSIKLTTFYGKNLNVNEILKAEAPEDFVRFLCSIGKGTMATRASQKSNYLNNLTNKLNPPYQKMVTGRFTYNC